MKPPPPFLEPLLRNIESVVLEMHEEYPKLIDKDIEWVYEKLVDYFKLKSRGKAKEEPTSPTERKQALLDEILNAIDEREENEDDEHLVNNFDFKQGEHPYPSLEIIYVQVFKRLKDSCRFWRKENGAKGYIKFISEFL